MADLLESRMNDDLMHRESSRQRVDILECTLRDGSYAVDFKFTENDTAILAGVLGQAVCGIPSAASVPATHNIVRRRV